MKKIIAQLFRFLFRISFFREKYFGFHEHFFSKYKLFKNISFQKIQYRKNILLNINLDDWIQQQIYFLGDYEKPEIDYLYYTLKKNDVFIDIGANIGLFSLNASRIIEQNGRVYAFEAFSQNYQQFISHIEINNMSNIISECVAISNEEGSIQILYDEDEKNVGMASAYLKNFTFKESVKSINLDQYILDKDIDRIDLIKIDIEGGEYNALLGMEKILQQYKPKLLIEINNEALENSNHNSQQIIDLLQNFGYKKKKILSSNYQSYNAVFEQY